MVAVHKVNILLVDDQPRNIVALEAAVSSIDCHVVTAHSGVEALKFLLTEDFALVLLDVHMPGMDGFETARLIRGRKRSESTPIIFLTADDRAGPRVVEGYRLGAVGYLYKPFDADILRAKVAIFVELFGKTAALVQRTAELTKVTADLVLRERQVVALSGELEMRVTERTRALEVAIADLEREASERKRAEETLQETAHQLRTVVNNTPVVLFAVDDQGIFTLFEGHALRSIGMEPGQPVGQPALGSGPDLSTLPSGAARLILAEDVTRALRGESFTAVVEAFGRVFELTYSPNLDSDGSLVGAIGIAVDVSERRALEERKDAFIATVSHELRTPLNGIIAISQLLQGTALDAPQQEYADIIHRSGQALHRLIDDVLTLARYQSGKVAIDDVDLDLRLALEDVTTLMVGPARAKGLDIFAQVAHEIPRNLRGDPGRLRQVLLNLAGNALKFTDSGSVLLRAQVDHSQTDRVSVRFEVQDTGVGIAPGVQARLFQPFEQADTSTTTRYGGTGLGLAICRQLVESMGGQIGLDSALGSGSTFWFVLSLARGESMDLVGRANLSGLRVLLTCDVPARAAALQELVRAWNMLSTAAATADDTTAILNEARADGKPFDAVVIALKDAAGAGAILARSLTEQPGGVGRHVVLVVPTDELAAVSSHMSGVPIISRPVRSSQLFEALALLLGADTSHADSTVISGPDVVDTPRGSGEQILVVDDAPMNQLVARRALEHLGYRAVLADGARTALRLHAEIEFAVVLMDCRMPEMDGFEATRRIRQREAAGGLRRVPIVALTANAQEGDRDNCLAAGMDDYLSKPLDINDLARVLRQWTIDMQTSPGSITDAVQPSAASPSDEPRWSLYRLDPSAIDGIREVQVPGEPDLFAEMVEAFLADACTQLVKLTDALACGDAGELANAAHSLKSGAGYLGARELQRLCLELETLGRSGGTQGGQALGDELQLAFEHTRRALTAELGRQMDAAA